MSNQEYNRYVSVSSVHTGGEFSLWSEAYVANGIVVLICVAQGGFHSYEWKCSNVVTCRWPITYENVPGCYTCTVQGVNISAQRKYFVNGKLDPIAMHL